MKPAALREALAYFGWDLFGPEDEDELAQVINRANGASEDKGPPLPLVQPLILHCSIVNADLLVVRKAPGIPAAFDFTFSGGNGAPDSAQAVEFRVLDTKEMVNALQGVNSCVHSTRDNRTCLVQMATDHFVYVKLLPGNCMISLNRTSVQTLIAYLTA